MADATCLQNDIRIYGRESFIVEFRTFFCTYNVNNYYIVQGQLYSAYMLIVLRSAFKIVTSSLAASFDSLLERLHYINAVIAVILLSYIIQDHIYI